MSSLITIYDYLKDYSKEEINFAIANLSNDFKYLLYMLFENQIYSNKEFYLFKVLIPKLKDILKKNRNLNNKKNDYLISKSGLIKINVYRVNNNLLDLARYYMEEISINYQDFLKVYSIKELVIALLLKKISLKYNYTLKDMIELFNINIEELKRINKEIVPLLDKEGKMVR